MPTAGTITGFQTQADILSNCTLNGALGPYDLQVLRPLGPNRYRVLGHTGDQIDPCDGQLHSYLPVGGPIAVKAGDVLGAYTVGAWRGAIVGSGSTSATSTSLPGVGDHVKVAPLSEAVTLDESATLVANG